MLTSPNKICFQEKKTGRICFQYAFMASYAIKKWKNMPFLEKKTREKIPSAWMYATGAKCILF